MHEGDGATILVVEDNEQLLKLLRRVLEREGYEVIAAASGIELMKLVYSSKPDLIVLDVGLPDVDGRDLLASLKKDPKTFSIPVLVWSGRDPDMTRRVVLDLGAEDYVEKGRPAILVSKIERVLLRISEGTLANAIAAIPGKA
jgi:two-component system, OmpR family, KDP operon response regulator KdpE